MNETENTQAFNAQTTELGQNGNFPYAMNMSRLSMKVCQRDNTAILILIRF